MGYSYGVHNLLITVVETRQRLKIVANQVTECPLTALEEVK